MSAPDDRPAADQPSAPIAQAAEATQAPEAPQAPEQRTRIIRRAPSGPIAASVDPVTTQIPHRSALEHDHSRSPRNGVSPFGEPSSRTAVAACAVSIVSGWATSVVATDLIAGWWSSSLLFCLAIAFLALVFAAATVSGVILLLQHRPVGRYLIVAGAVVALLTYCGIFIAGARVAWIVHTLPLLPVASIFLALHPNTKRWLQE